MQESIDTGRVREQTGPRASRNQLQTTTLLDAIEEHGFDAVMGGARRDEERARAKERIFSFRDDFGQWNPRRAAPRAVGPLQRAHPQGRAHPRVPDLELDGARRVAVRRAREPRAAVDLLRARREVFKRDGMLYAVSDFMERYPDEEPFTADGALPHGRRHVVHRRRLSEAATIDEVVAEIAATRVTERGETRADDRVSEAAMEDRKRDGYF